MRKIDKLLCTAIIPPLLIALTVLTFIAFMEELSKLSEVLVTGNAPIQVIAAFVSTIAPNVLVFSLPLSFLIGTQIGVSGLSGE